MTHCNSKPRVMVTGAAGFVFTNCGEFLRGRYVFKCTDLRASPPAIEPLDLLDFPAVRAAMEGCDAVVHMAIASHRATRHLPPHEADDEEMRVNLMATQHVYEAARQLDVKRVVYFSSMTVVLGEPAPTPIERNYGPQPRGLYGTTKLFGEQLGEMYSREKGLSVVCVRLGQPVPTPGRPWGSDAMRHTASFGVSVAFEDIARAIDCALSAPQSVRFHVFNAVSRCPLDRVDLSAGREIGFEPQCYVTADGIKTIKEMA